MSLIALRSFVGIGPNMMIGTEPKYIDPNHFESIGMTRGVFLAFSFTS